MLVLAPFRLVYGGHVAGRPEPFTLILLAEVPHVVVVFREVGWLVGTYCYIVYSVCSGYGIGRGQECFYAECHHISARLAVLLLHCCML